MARFIRREEARALRAWEAEAAARARVLILLRRSVSDLGHAAHPHSQRPGES